MGLEPVFTSRLNPGNSLLVVIEVRLGAIATLRPVAACKHDL